MGTHPMSVMTFQCFTRWPQRPSIRDEQIKLYLPTVSFIELTLFETEAPKTLGVFNGLSLEELQGRGRWTELRKKGRTLTWPANGIQFGLCDIGSVAIIKENEKPVRKQGWWKDQGVTLNMTYRRYPSQVPLLCSKQDTLQRGVPVSQLPSSRYAFFPPQALRMFP